MKNCRFIADLLLFMCRNIRVLMDKNLLSWKSLGPDDPFLQTSSWMDEGLHRYFIRSNQFKDRCNTNQAVTAERLTRVIGPRLVE